MFSKLHTISISFALLILSIPTKAQNIVKSNASLHEVTVYKAGAALQHTAKVNLPSGSSEVVINNVASNIDENSIQISAPQNVTIMSVLLARNYQINDESSTNPEYLRRNGLVKDAVRKLNNIRNEKDATLETINMLKKNESIGGSNSGVNITELSKMTEYYLSKQTELKNKYNELQVQETEQNIIVQKLNAELGELQNGGFATGGQLVVQIMASQATNTSLNITYLSPNAGWTAAYDLRAENTKDPLKILYKANVVQNTGIDWKKVKLTLSTGNPTQGGTAPLLSTWFLRYGYPNTEYRNLGKENSMGSTERDEYRKTQNVPLSEIETALNGAAPGINVSSGVDQYTSVSENTVTTNFDIDIPYDIASNAKPHSVTLKEYRHPVNYKFYAVPKLDPDVFLLAELTDYQKLDLVPGEANIIFENMYVGKTYIQPNQTNDTLNLSMGRDKRISVKREKIADSSGDKFLGSNVTKTFTYELSVRNNKSQNIEIILKDQYPISTDDDIVVTLTDEDNAAINKETGVLTWKLKLAPNESKKVRFTYTIKYPKNKVLGNL